MVSPDQSAMTEEAVTLPPVTETTRARMNGHAALYEKTNPSEGAPEVRVIVPARTDPTPSLLTSMATVAAVAPPPSVA
jgi:hypothetical protein